jgi:hypothetical protein
MCASKLDSYRPQGRDLFPSAPLPLGMHGGGDLIGNVLLVVGEKHHVTFCVIDLFPPHRVKSQDFVSLEVTHSFRLLSGLGGMFVAFQFRDAGLERDVGFAAVDSDAIVTFGGVPRVTDLLLKTLAPMTQTLNLPIAVGESLLEMPHTLPT